MARAYDFTILGESAENPTYTTPTASGDFTTKQYVDDAIAASGYATPTTTEGDLILRGSSADERLAIGANGYVLTSNGTTASWQEAAGGLTKTSETITSAANFIEPHLFDNDSFNWTELDKLEAWSLNNTYNPANTGSSFTLTGVGSPTFSSSYRLGYSSSSPLLLNGSSQCAYSATTLPHAYGGTLVRWMVGGWFYSERDSQDEIFLSVYKDSDGERDFILGRNNTASTIYFRVYDGTTNSSYDEVSISEDYLPLNTWTHIAGQVFTGYGTRRWLKIFVNGKLIKQQRLSNVTTSLSSDPTVDFTIGAYDGSGTPGSYFDGAICNVFYGYSDYHKAILDTALSSRYAAPSTLSGTDYDYKIYHRVNNTTDIPARLYPTEARRTSSYVYINWFDGGLFDSMNISNPLKIVAEELTE